MDRPPRFRNPGTLAAFLLLLSLTSQPAPAQTSRNITLLSHLDSYKEYSACWSYVHDDGREYAILGATSGASIVRLTDPTHPVEVAFIPLKETFWHEMKQYRHYVYISTDGLHTGTRALEILDMSDPDRPKRVGSFNTDLGFIHTVTVDAERGFLYLSGMPPEEEEAHRASKRDAVLRGDDDVARHPDGPGIGSMHIYSLADPERPVEVGHYGEYVHDIHVIGTRGFASLIFDGYLAVLDLSDPSDPKEITRFRSPRFFTHSAWTNADERYLYICDEMSGPRSLSAWDISDIQNPVPAWTHEALPRHIPHNPRVRGNDLFLSHYTAGVRVWDLANPAWPVEYGYYDTFDSFDGGFYGNWEVAPYFPSGIFIISDINSGLYVFRVEPRHHGIVRGTVQDEVSGAPLAGATITAQPGGMTVRSGFDGRFAMALDAPNSYTLTVTALRYQTGTFSPAGVALGSDETILAALHRADVGFIEGTVTTSGVGPLDAAELVLEGTPFRGTSDAAGHYRIDPVPVGPYVLRCLRPGFAPGRREVTLAASGTTSNFALMPATFYDDVETDRGWKLQISKDDAATGRWIRDVPTGSGSPSFFQPQPGADHTPGAGTRCFVTGNFPDPFNPLAGSVTDGKTTLTSPSLPIGGIVDPRIGFWRWYTNEWPAIFFAVEDALVTQISGDGGRSWITVDSSLRTTNAWEYVEIRVRDRLPTATSVQVRIVAEDGGLEPSLVEAALDDFAVYSGEGGGARFATSSARVGGSELIPFSLRRSGPNPSRGGVSASLSLGHPAWVGAEVFDVHGRLVRSLEMGTLPAGTHEIAWDGRLRDGSPAFSGVYWMRVRAGSENSTLRIVVTR